jgi:hypothetical protein
MPFRQILLNYQNRLKIAPAACLPKRQPAAVSHPDFRESLPLSAGGEFSQFFLRSLHITSYVISKTFGARVASITPTRCFCAHFGSLFPLPTIFEPPTGVAEATHGEERQR